MTTTQNMWEELQQAIRERRRSACVVLLDQLRVALCEGDSFPVINEISDAKRDLTT